MSDPVASRSWGSTGWPTLAAMPTEETNAGGPTCTIVVVPRERFSLADKSLENILEQTEQPYELVYVDGNSPRQLRSYLEGKAAEAGFRLVRSDHYLSPNQARNLGLAHVTTKYVVFVDNDLFVTPGWLSRLVQCAEDTGAWLVGPLYYEGDPKDEIIHMAGGDIELTGEAPHRSFATTHRFQRVAVADVPEPLRREPCDFVEFHCMLARTEIFGQVGLLDEKLMCTREHLDICMRVREIGGEVYFEPTSIVTYRTPPPFAPSDLPFYWLRWSDTWGRISLEHFCEKYGIDERYARRVRIMTDRRQKVFRPVRKAVGRTFGRKAERAVAGAIMYTEREVNKVLVKALSPKSP